MKKSILAIAAGAMMVASLVYADDCFEQANVAAHDLGVAMDGLSLSQADGGVNDLHIVPFKVTDNLSASGWSGVIDDAGKQSLAMFAFKSRDVLDEALMFLSSNDQCGNCHGESTSNTFISTYSAHNRNPLPDNKVAASSAVIRVPLSPG